MLRQGFGLLAGRSGRLLVRRLAVESGESTTGEQKTEANKRVFKKMRGTGDKGQSGLFSGERRWKDDIIFEALGTCDELSCALGLVREHLEVNGLFGLVEKVTAIQCDLQDIMAHLATPRDCGHQRLIERTKFEEWQVDLVDSWIDEYARGLPELTLFIIPGGGLLAAHAHQARATCRRAERRVSAIVREQRADTTVMKYLNRLSDFLFVLARYACFSLNRPEIQYKKSRRSDSKAGDTRKVT